MPRESMQERKSRIEAGLREEKLSMTEEPFMPMLSLRFPETQDGTLTSAAQHCYQGLSTTQHCD